MKRTWNVPAAPYDDGAPHPPPPGCPGVGRLVRYDDFKSGRSACPVCGHESQIVDMHDRDPSVFVYVGDHARKEEKS